jgi:predicted  nucleic acid-binding Zn-ribbon protein
MTDSTETIAVDADGEVELPIIDLLTGRGFVTGKSGSGKSTTASVIAEELLGNGHPLLIVDTDGEYYGLKEQYEVLHAGADEECDVQVGPEHAAKLADLALDAGVPIILDISGYLDDDEARELVRAVAEALFQREQDARQPFLLLIEEVHEYIPEGGGLDECGEMLVRVAKRGRKRGLGLCGISQRPADVKKDVITQCDWLCWHRLTWDNDTAVVRRVMGSEPADRVQDLDDGEAILETDWDGTRRRVQVRQKETFDAGATPGLGDVERPDLKSIGEDLIGDLEAISERQREREDRLARLEDEIDSRDERIADLEDELGRAQDMTDMAEQFTTALTASGGDGEALEARIEEIREEKDETIRELRRERDALESDLQATWADRDDLEQEAHELREQVEELEEYRDAAANLDEVREAVARAGEALGIGESGDGEKYRRKLDSARDRVDELKDELEEARRRADRAEAQAGEMEIGDDYTEFLDVDVVQEQIAEAKAESGASPRYVKGVVAAIMDEGDPVAYDDIADRLGVSTTSDVSKAASTLETMMIVEKDRRDDGMVVDLNTDGIQEVREAAARRGRTQELMGGL